MGNRWCVTRSRLTHAWRRNVESVAVVALVCAPMVATATPPQKVCAKVQNSERASCVRKHTAWPAHPTLREVRNRMTAYEWGALRWICRHEQPGRGWNGCRWDTPASWTFVGGLGMARSTYSLGVAVTAYRYPPEATPAEQMAVGVIVMRRFGPSAWDSWGSR